MSKTVSRTGWEGLETQILVQKSQKLVFRFFEGFRPRDHDQSIKHQDAGAIRLNESSVRPNATSLVTKQNSERKSERKQSHNPYPWGREV